MHSKLYLPELSLLYTIFANFRWQIPKEFASTHAQFTYTHAIYNVAIR